MRKRSKGLILLACFALAISAVVLARRDKEPSCHGIRLSEWIAMYNRHDPGFRLEAQEALEEIGTNALPFLIEWISYEPPKWKTFLREEKEFNRRMRWIPRSATSSPGIARAGEAMVAFRILGPSAAPAIPYLQALAKSTDPDRGQRARIALGLVGPPAIPALLQLLTDPTSTSDTRFGALRNLNELVYAAMLSSTLGTNAVQAMPLLIKSLDDKDTLVASEAASVLGTLKREPAAVVPALLDALQNTNSRVRADAAHALGEFGTNATVALPALKAALDDPDDDVRRAATNSVRRVTTGYW